MAYSTVANVQSEFKALTIDGSSPLTTTEVTEFISQADTEIDAYIGTKYSTPVSSSTAPISIILLRQLSTWLTAHRVQEKLQVKSVSQEVDQEGNAVSLRQRAIAILEKIQKGQITLSDATLANTQDGVSDYNSVNSVAPLFDAELEQW